MADTKITELGTAASLASADLFVIADDPAGTPVSRSVRVDTIRADVVADSTSLAAIRSDVEANANVPNYWAQTAAEVTAAVTPSDYSYEPGNVLRYGAAGDGSTDDTTAIQSAIDVVEQLGGGNVWFPSGTYIVSDTVTVNGPVWLRGEGASFEQIFTASPTFSGSVIKLASSSFNSASDAIIEFDYTGVGGEARLHAGASNILVFGNRGTAADPTDASAKDNNAYGIGFFIKGARYVTLDHCFAVWCAEDGVQSASDGVSSNNIRIIGGGYISNADDGLDLSGGDSFVADVQLGYNGGDGMACAVGVITLSGIACWDNFGYGLRITEDDCVVSGGNFYDNQLAGILISGTRERIAVAGAICQDNGKDTGQADQIRSGIYVSGACTNSSIVGVSTSNKDETGSTGQVYGLRITDTSTDVKYAVISGDNNGTSLISDLSLGSELTISTGAVTVTKDFHRVDTESDAASDDLDTINGGSEGDRLLIKPANGARTVNVSHGTGNIVLSGQTDFFMSEAEDTLSLIKIGSSWIETSRSDTTALGSYTVTNLSTDRSYDANTVTLAELADVVGTLITDLKARDEVD